MLKSIKVLLLKKFKNSSAEYTKQTKCILTITKPHKTKKKLKITQLRQLIL